MTEEKKSMLAAAGAYSIFGLSFLFSKMALHVAEPMILLCVRFAVTILVLNALVLFRAVKLHLRGKNLLGPIILGILQPVLYFVMENYGLKYTTTSFTGIIASVSPIITAVLGVFLLRERPNGKQWACVCISIAGVMMISLGSGGGENTLAGCLCLLGAYLVGALYSILARKLSTEFSAFDLTYVMFHLGFAFFAVMAFVQYGGNTLPVIGEALTHGKFLAAILYLGAAASVGAFMLSNYALGRLAVTRVTIFNCFSTLISVLSGVIVMGDPFTWLSGVAFALILIGVVGVNAFAPRE